MQSTKMSGAVAVEEVVAKVLLLMSAVEILLINYAPDRNIFQCSLFALIKINWKKFKVKF